MITSSSLTSHLLHRLSLVLVAAAALGSSLGAPKTRLMVDYSEVPESWELSAFDLCILKADAKVDLEAAHSLGNKCLARLPIFEVPSNSAAALRAQQLGVPLLDGTVRGVSRLDATHAGWASVVVHELAETAAERGFDGVVLAELETISQDAERAALIRMISLLRATYPDKLIFLEGGFDLLSEVRRELDGILFIEQEGEKEARRLDHRVRESTRLGVQSYVVGFADAAKPGDIAGRAAHYSELGAVPFFTTEALTGVNLGPLQEISRRVLVLHTGAARETFTAQILHGSLEWLGYQMIYQDASSATESDLLPAHMSVNAVILDQHLKLSAERQKNLADLAVRLAIQKVPLLITGQPWEAAADWHSVATALGIEGTGKVLPADPKATIEKAESALLMDQAAKTARTTGLRDMRAAPTARVILSVKHSGKERTQAFLASWGGLWLEPLALEAGPQVSPLPYLESWLSAQVLAPVADTTCLDGRRLLVSQITAEGFSSMTSLPGLPLAAEAMQERILSRYALPMTVALCEADVRGWTPGQEPRLSLRLQEAARSIFRLSQVEAASYSFSRPETWTGEVAGMLNAAAPAQQSGMEREIAGSMSYIHRNLLPKNRSVALMCWPQGAAPSDPAVAFTQKISVENVETVITAPLPAGRQAALPARTWGRDENFQTLLRQTRSSSALDAEAEIAQARQTGALRWLSPVQVSLNFSDAANETSLKQTERLMDWCASQPLHAISLSHYAKLSRDAARTRIFQTGPARWIIVNNGLARTLRLPASIGVPDLAHCTGVVGYMQQGDQLYIHTLGLRRTELVLRSEPVRDHLRLASSSASVRYLEAGSRRALLQVNHSRPVEMAFAGLLPGTLCQLLANGQPDYLMADTSGRIEFTVPNQATVQLRVLPAHQAAMR